MSETNYEILEEIGILSQDSKGNTKKLVLIRWFDKPPIFEIRSFSVDGKPLKRAALTAEELETLYVILDAREGE